MKGFPFVFLLGVLLLTIFPWAWAQSPLDAKPDASDFPSAAPVSAGVRPRLWFESIARRTRLSKRPLPDKPTVDEENRLNQLYADVPDSKS